MERLDTLRRIPAIAEAMQRAGPGGSRDGGPEDTDGPWTLTAREPGHPGTDSLKLPDFAQGRAMALELSERGLVVVLFDRDHRARLRIWPPH